MWYVYILTDPRNGKPFYVGKGKNYRISATVNINQTGNKLKKIFLSEIKDAGLSPIVDKIAEYEYEIDALEHEKKLITEYGRIIKDNGILVNYSEGGDDSNAGWVPSEETRKLWSEQRKGRKQTKEHIGSRTKQTTGKKRSVIQKHNYVLASIRRTRPELKAQIYIELENTEYRHGLYAELAKKFNCDCELISKIHKKSDLYKEALYEWIQKQK
jgi:hypothetical protein